MGYSGNMSAARWWWLAPWALCAVMGCGRVGYDLLALQGAVEQGATDPDPFGGAETGSVTVDETGARLGHEPGFALAPSTLPVRVAAGAACGSGENVLVAGGSETFPSYTTCAGQMLKYMRDGTVSTLGDLPWANQGLALHEMGGALYSVMGYCGGPSADEQNVYRFPSLGATPALVGTFPHGAYHFSSGVVKGPAGDQVLAVAGGYGSGPLREQVQTMTADGVATVLTSTLPTARCMAGHGTTQDSLLLFGGSEQVDCLLPATAATDVLLDEIVSVTPGTDSVEVVDHLPQSVAASCAVTRANGDIYIFGGVHYVEESPGTFTREVIRSVYCYTPSTGSFEDHGELLPAPRAAMSCAVTADDRVVLFGGVGPDLTPTDEILMFEPQSETGWLTGALMDSGVAGARWTEMKVTADVPDGTTLTMAVRISDDPVDFASALDWTDVSGLVITLPDDLPRGQYVQWRATLTSADGSSTPTLHSVKMHYAP